MSRPSLLFVISAPSGAGKTTVLRELMRRVPGMRFSVSHTTRPKRPGEIDGQDYHFVDRDGFAALLREDGFIEHAEVHGELYGTSLQEWEQAQNDGVDLVLDIDVQGAAQVRSRVHGAVTIFILPPHRKDLERRLRSRGDVEEARLQRRLAGAVAEVKRAAEYDDVVVNDDLMQCVACVEAIIRAARCRGAWAGEAVRSAVSSFGVSWGDHESPKE